MKTQIGKRRRSAAAIAESCLVVEACATANPVLAYLKPLTRAGSSLANATQRSPAQTELVLSVS